MKPCILSLLALSLFSPGARAQEASQTISNPVSTAVRAILERQARNLVASAQEMPAEKYGFRPTPAQMTFGHLVMHVTGSNYFLCSNISGEKAPERENLSDTNPKDKLVSAMRASFDFCTQALAKVDDSMLGERVPFFGGRSLPRAAAMIALTNDFADHYAMAAMYLRLNGLLPPTAQRYRKD